MEVALLIFSGSIVGMMIMILIRSFYPRPAMHQSSWYKIDVSTLIERAHSEFRQRARPFNRFFLGYIFIAGRAIRIMATRLYMKMHKTITPHLGDQSDDSTEM